MRAVQLGSSLALAIMLACCATAVVAEEQNQIFADLMQNGVALSDGTKVQLPKPVMANGLNAAAQQKVMAGLVPAQRLASFLAGKVPDWFELKIAGEPASGPGKVSGRKIDLYYVANGPLEALSDKGFLKEALGEGGDNFHIFTATDLKQEKLDVAADTDTTRERYAHAKLDLFNMAKVEGTGRGISTSNKDSVLIAFALDPKFADNKTFPNQYRMISRGAAGNKVVSEPHRYQGFGGYVKVTRVANAASPQVFIEYHLVFEEPFEWFDGKPVLTSKLPDKVQADVRSFRRKLADFARANPNVAAGPQANANPGANAAKQTPDATQKADQVNAAAAPAKEAIEAK